METRQLVAYLLILLLAAFLAGVWLRLTRDARARARLERARRRRRVDREADDCPCPGA